MNYHRFLILLSARNKEMLRDPSGWVWNILLPLILMVGIAFLIKDDDQSLYKIGYIQAAGDSKQISQNGNTDSEALQQLKQHAFARFIAYTTLDEALKQLQTQQLTLVISDTEPLRYWTNTESIKSQLLEKALFAETPPQKFERMQISGKKIRYLDWVVTGVLGITIMHACLFGVGFIIVRQRKNGVLKRLNITPVKSGEFLLAHVFARMTWLLTAIPFLFFCMHLLFDFYMAGAYWLLLLVLLFGSLSMLALALLVASRTDSEETVLGLLNLITWPMVFLSGVWFSLDGAPAILRLIAQVFPLTHLLAACRAVMLDGAGMTDIWPSLAILLAMSVGVLSLAAWRFKWS